VEPGREAKADIDAPAGAEKRGDIGRPGGAGFQFLYLSAWSEGDYRHAVNSAQQKGRHENGRPSALVGLEHG
jgi:hypothetical protein